MNDEEFDRYVAECLEFAETRNQELMAQYNLGEFERWQLNQTTRTLAFWNGETSGPAFLIDGIGTQSSEGWLWAWANDSLTAEMKQASRELIQLAQSTGFSFFENPRIKADDNMAWEISGMALHHIGGLGIYRCPSDNSNLFVLLREVLPDDA